MEVPQKDWNQNYHIEKKKACSLLDAESKLKKKRVT
jgi:hypothetical protein